MIYKLRHYVPLSTLRIVYYSMFHSHIQYSLLNWGRAAKSHFHKLSILRNKILRACLFCPRCYETNLLYSRFTVLKLVDMIKMEFAKFTFKYSTNMLPIFFNNYFIKLEDIHNYNTGTRQKSRNEYFQTSFGTETRKKTLHYLGLNEWKSIPKEYRQCSFTKFKKFCKNKLLNNYN